MQLILNPQALRHRAHRKHVRRYPERRRRGAGRVPSACCPRPPSATGKPSGAWVGLYEPVHGSAPDIAGQNKANPLGAIGSVARHAGLQFRFEGGSRRGGSGHRSGPRKRPRYCGLAAFRRARHHRTGWPSGMRRDRLSAEPTGPPRSAKKQTGVRSRKSEKMPRATLFCLLAPDF